MLPTQIDRNRSSEAGFTLIELSIVLIIIGLLIGGVLQGQEMINNTRIKTTVSQTDSVQAAIQTFEDKFGAMPGDFNQADLLQAANNNGNNDNIIDLAANGNAAVDPNTAVTASSEASQVFDHLADANLLQGVSDVNNDGTYWNMNTRVDGGAMDVGTFAFTELGDGVGIRLSGSALAANALLSPQDAFSLDTKYDDGVGDQGRWEAGNGADNGAGVNCFTGTTAGGNFAWAAGNAEACFIAISIR